MFSEQLLYESFFGGQGITAIALAQLWQVTLVAIVALITARTVARNRPHLSVAIWLLVLAKCVTPPVLSSPTGVFCWLQPDADSSADVEIESASTERSLNEPAGHVQLLSLMKSVHTETDTLNPDAKREATSEQAEMTSLAVVEHLPADVGLPASRQSKSNASTLRHSILAIWLGGSLLMFVVSGVRCWRCLRTIRRTSQPAERMIQSASDRIARKLKLRRQVRVLVTNSRIGPAVIGLFRTVVVIPKAIMESAKPGEIELIIAHELTHIRRGDLWLGMFQLMAGAIWWFHPLVRMVNRMAVRDAERCCDEEVIGRFGYSTTAYARSLVNVLQCKQALIPAAAFPGVRPIDITTRRLERIMKLKNGCNKRTPVWCWLTVLFASLIVLPGAALGVVQTTENPQTNQQAVSSAASTRDAEAASATTTVEYEVADLVSRLMDVEKLDLQSACPHLLLHLHTMMQIPLKPEQAAKLFGKPTETVAGREKSEEDGQGLETGSSVLNWKTPGKTLVVTSNGDMHAQVRQAISIVRTCGFGQTTVAVKYVWCSAKVLDKISTKLELSQATSTGFPDDSLQSDDLPWHDGKAKDYEVRAVVQQEQPLVSGTMDVSELRDIQNLIQADRLSNVLAAPKITAFNGQKFSIFDGVTRPFRVGLKEGKPVVRACQEGTSTVMRIQPMGETGVDLEFKLISSKIKRVDEFTFEKEGKDVTVQKPQTERVSISGMVSLDKGDSYIVGGFLPPDKEKDAQRLLVIFTPQRISQQIEAEEDKGVNAALNTFDKALSSLSEAKSAETPDLVAKSGQDGIHYLRKLRTSDQEDFSGKPLVAKVYRLNDIATELGPLLPGFGKASGMIGRKVDFGKEIVKGFGNDIAPHTWKQNGGKGTAEFDPHSLALLVSQYPSVHAEIANMLIEVRSYVSNKATVRISAIEAAPEAWDKIRAAGIDSDVGSLTKIETFFLMQAMKNDERFHLRNLPEISLMNGQSCGFSSDAFFSEEFQSIFELGLLTLEEDEEFKLAVRFACGTSDQIKDLANRDYGFHELAPDAEPLVPQIVTEASLKQGESMMLQFSDATATKASQVMLLITRVSGFKSEAEEIALEHAEPEQVQPASHSEPTDLPREIQFLPDVPKFRAHPPVR